MFITLSDGMEYILVLHENEVSKFRFIKKYQLAERLIKIGKSLKKELIGSGATVTQ